MQKPTRKKDKIYLTIFIMVAVVVGGLSYWTLQKGIEEIEENSARIQNVVIRR